MDAHHLVSAKPNPKVPPFRPGDTIQVNYIIREGERVRTQTFQGVVIRRVGGKSPVATFTVRRVSHGIGVERIFPLYSPHIDSVNVLRQGKVRRARLYYLRDRFGRAARIKERVVLPGQRAVAALPKVEEEVEAEAVVEVGAALGVVAAEAGVAQVEAEETEAGELAEETATVAETEGSDAPVDEAAEAAPVAESEEPEADAAPEQAEDAPAAEEEETPVAEAPEAAEEEATPARPLLMWVDWVRQRVLRLPLRVEP